MKTTGNRPTRRILGVLLVLAAFSGPAGGAETVVLSIGEAVRIAISRNLGLKVASYSPAIAETDIRKARSIYDPSLTAHVDHRETNLTSGPGFAFVDRQRYYHFDTAISQLLPTGATTSLSFTNLFFRDNLGLPTSDYARPELVLSFSQPLLKGFGQEVTERGITTADDALDSALTDWNQQALDTAADARNRYLALVKARENLATRRASLALARQIHSENGARVNAGVLASFQMQDSLLGVLQRQSELLEAERSARDAADQLVTALNLPARTTIEDSGIPDPEKVLILEEEAMMTAMARRPDMAKARVAVRTAEFNEGISRNLALPSLALEGSAGLAGFNADYDNAMEDLGGGKYPEWSVGLTFSVPIGNSAARADLAANRLKASQARTRLTVVEETVGLEVRAALRALEIRREQIDVTTQGVTAAETLVASYRKRQQLGLATTKDLLDVEAGLTLAKESLTGARADYHAALTDLWKATGELLDREGLRLEGKAPEWRKQKGNR